MKKEPRAKKRIHQASQLPRHVYAVPESLSGLLKDGTAFSRLLEAIRSDQEEDLRAYEISDKATLKSYYRNLALIAILEGRWDKAPQLLERVKDLEEKPAAKLLTGVLELSILKAKKAPKDSYVTSFSAEYEKALRAVPYDCVQADLKASKGAYQMRSENLLLGSIDEEFGTAAKAGSISSDIAVELLAAYFTLEEIFPLKEALIEVLGRIISERAVDKPDIWGAREVTLDETEPLTSVVVAIWDTGTDVSLFPGRLFVDPAVAHGDDSVCDLLGDSHGIAWTWNGERDPGPLRRTEVGPAELRQFKRFLKGACDLEANVSSPEAEELRTHLTTLPRDQVKPFLDGLNLYIVCSHGTHVAGIAARGNPGIRILVARIDFLYQLVQPPPTLEWAGRFARMIRETIAYFKANGVRVVNMSWLIEPSEFERTLEINNKGASAEDRRAMALNIFDIIAKEFAVAIQKAPEILFVAGAGNSNRDVRFNQHLPSGFDFPNIISAGAVDRAGDEASFTCFGKVDVYANGCEVESVLPGGEIQKLSGTSMSAPQVANLAAKLLARFPARTAHEVRQLILDGCDEKALGQHRYIRLLNPKRSFELAARWALNASGADH